MFSKPNEHAVYNGPQFAGSLYFLTDDAEAWWGFLKDKATIVYPIEDFSYGMREFAIKDCNGYILQVGQDIEDNKLTIVFTKIKSLLQSNRLRDLPGYGLFTVYGRVINRCLFPLFQVSNALLSQSPLFGAP